VPPVFARPLNVRVLADLQKQIELLRKENRNPRFQSKSGNASMNGRARDDLAFAESRSSVANSWKRAPDRRAQTVTAR